MYIYLYVRIIDYKDLTSMDKQIYCSLFRGLSGVLVILISLIGEPLMSGQRSNGSEHRNVGSPTL